MATNNIRTSGGIFTHHFIESLLQDTLNHPAMKVQKFALPRQEKFSEKELENKISTAWEALIERWDAVEREFGALDISALRQRWLRPLFFYLKIEPEFQRGDIVLEGDLRFPISHLGRIGTTEFTLPVHSVLYDKEAKSDTLDTRVGAGRGMKKVAPHDMVQRYLNLSKEHDWALLTDGVYLRLLRDFHHTYTRGYIEFDLQGIFNSRDFAGFRAMYRLLHASRFVIDSEKEAAPIDALYEDALAMGVRVGEDLRKNVQAAIESLANGFLVSSPGFIERISQQEDGSAQLYRDVLMTIYRMLFLLFAEQRGMLPGRGSLYMEAFSLTAFRTLAEQPASEDRNLDLWEQIKTTFSMVEHGVEELGIFAYNGALFSLKRTPLLTPDDPAFAPRCRNDYFMRAVRHLTVVERDKVRQRISYSDLSVEEIGSIYESLLEFTPQISESQLEVEGRLIPANTFYLDPRGSGRKTSGSYYTPPSLVNELIKSALVPVMEDRIQAVVPGYDPELVEALTDEERQAAEEAILALNVVDPAAGSGAFLIAANNKLALELARIRSGEYFPPEEITQHARRDVLAHCIYAVDYNPMAVELCKVSLWINAAVEDAPLNFLDHHIRWGNSLVGASPALIKEGIPNDAYKPVTGDDKEIAKAIKAQNRAELKGQMGLMRVTTLKTQEDIQNWSQIAQLAEDDPGKAEAAYYAYFGSKDYWEQRLPYDLWTVAFFAQLVESEPIPTTQDVRQAQADPSLVSHNLKIQTRHLAERYRFFHWHLEFSEMFDNEGNGGFDIVLGNPPWERIKLQEKEFFFDRSEKISNARRAADRRKLISNLKNTDTNLWKEYIHELEKSEKTSKFIRYSERYPLTGRGDINTYSVFSETTRSLLNSYGRVGIVIPTGIATDFTYSDYFRSLVDSGELVSLYDFENKLKIFPDVAPIMKFCLITLAGKEQSVEKFDAAFFLTNFDQLADKDRHFTLTLQEFYLINPNTGNCPTFRNKKEAEITKAIYRSSFPLVLDGPPITNLWNISFLRMLDMTNDSSHFFTQDELASKGLSQQGNIFLGDDDVFLPLYEAKLVDQFDHRSSSFEGLSGEAVFKPKAATITPSKNDKASSIFSITPRFWVSIKKVKNNIPSHWKHWWFIGFRDIIQPMTNARCAIFSIIPRIGAGNSLPIILPNKNPVQINALIANFNSFIFDYVARQKIGGTHMNFYIVKQLPIIRPESYSTNTLKFILQRTLELIYTSWDLRSFADDLWENSDNEIRAALISQRKNNKVRARNGDNVFQPPKWLQYLYPENSTEQYPYPPFEWDDKRRFQIRCELDALYGHLYGLTRDELDYILDTFPIVKRKDEAEYGEYRIKRVVLEEFEKLADDPMLEGVCVPLAERVSVFEQPEKEQPTAPKQPKTVTQEAVFSEPEPATKAKTKEEKPVSKPKVPENQTQLFAEETDFSAKKTDWNRYRCQKCNKSVMGFSIEEHTHEVHQGQDPGYKQV
jgi:hypothetical protein